MSPRPALWPPLATVPSTCAVNPCGPISASRAMGVQVLRCPLRDQWAFLGGSHPKKPKLPTSPQNPMHKRPSSLGFPGGAVVENLPANAGDTGSSPGLGRSHMPRSNWAREPQLLSLRVWSLCSATREAAIVRGPRTAMNSGPRLPQLKKAHIKT